MNIVTGGLAAYRLARIVREDKVAEAPRARVLAWAWPPGRPIRHRWMVDLLECPWCLSVWTGAALVAGELVAPRTTRIAARLLAFSAVAGVLHDLADEDDRRVAFAPR